MGRRKWKLYQEVITLQRPPLPVAQSTSVGSTTGSCVTATTTTSIADAAGSTVTKSTNATSWPNRDGISPGQGEGEIVIPAATIVDGDSTVDLQDTNETPAVSTVTAAPSEILDNSENNVDDNSKSEHIEPSADEDTKVIRDGIDEIPPAVSTSPIKSEPSTPTVPAAPVTPAPQAADWTPQDKCYFCVEGQLLRVGPDGGLIATKASNDVDVNNYLQPVSYIKFCTFTVILAVFFKIDMCVRMYKSDRDFIKSMTRYDFIVLIIWHC